MDGNGMRVMQRRDDSFVKLQVFIPGTLRREIGIAAEEAGQSLTVFVARALVAHLMRTKAAADPTGSPHTASSN
jgi:hypothetical protein